MTGLCCRRGDTELFRDVAFSLAGREVLVVEGANGSGKTSLLRILSGLAACEEGTITWNGVDVTEDPETYRRAIAYVGHRKGISEDLSALENVAFAAALGTGADATECRRALVKVGLADAEHAPARRLSAGQQQRLALARLVVTAAPLWLLDEPFTALDASARAQVGGLLDAHLDGGGLCVVATHQALPSDHASLSRLRLGAA